MEKVYNQQTLWSKILNFSFVFTSSKRYSSSVKSTKKFIEKRNNKENYIKDKEFEAIEFDDHKVYLYNGSLDNLDKKVLIYIHGGNFLEPGNKYQIGFAKTIAKSTDSLLIVPMYDLLPNGNALKMHEFLMDLYIMIQSLNPKEINLLGDSAGGGAILTLSILLKEKKLLMPKNIIMLSPWLDLSMSNPDIIADEKKDHMNGLEGTKYEGKLWADNLDIKDIRVSPMYGNFKGIKGISIFYGGKEILTSECKRFIELLKKQNVEFNSYYYTNEGHDFAVFPTKEGKHAIKEIIDIIGGNNYGRCTRENIKE